MATIMQIKELRTKCTADYSTCNRYLKKTNGNIQAALALIIRDKAGELKKTQEEEKT